MSRHCKISVIVPVYNVEKYIKKCVESLINQTYKNLEIILVDDGSSDQSGNICDLYSNKKNILVFHKKNGGLSDARNYGIKRASGDYLAFIDSDDYIDYDFFEKLIKVAQEQNSDIVSGAKILEYPRKKIALNNKFDFNISKEEALYFMFLKKEFDNSACDKIYKRELFNDIKFPKNKYYEDMYTIYKLVQKSSIISHTKNTYYHYLIRENSISNENFSIKQLDCVDASYNSYMELSNINEDVMYATQAYYILQISNCIQKIYNSKNKETFEVDYKILKQRLAKLRCAYLKNRCISFKKKIMILFVDLGWISIVNVVKKRMYN